MSKQQNIYCKVGRCYQPIGIEGRPWDGLTYGNYVMLVKEGITSIKRLPDVHLSFTETVLCELEDKVCRDLDQWMEHRATSFSRVDLAEFVAGVVRKFLQGEEVGR